VLLASRLSGLLLLTEPCHSLKCDRPRLPRQVNYRLRIQDRGPTAFTIDN
jgi:hypothetical protein